MRYASPPYPFETPSGERGVGVRVNKSVDCECQHDLARHFFIFCTCPVDSLFRSKTILPPDPQKLTSTHKLALSGNRVGRRIETTVVEGRASRVGRQSRSAAILAANRCRQDAGAPMVRAQSTPVTECFPSNDHSVALKGITGTGQGVKKWLHSLLSGEIMK